MLLDSVMSSRSIPYYAKAGRWMFLEQNVKFLLLNQLEAASLDGFHTLYIR